MKKNIVLRAPLLSYSGYGEHSRQIFKWLLSRDDFNVYTNIVRWGTTAWMIDPEMEDGIIAEAMNRSGQTDIDFDMSFQVQLPDEWDPSLAKINIGISAAVETDRAYENWSDCVDKMDGVIFPSNHSKMSVINAGVTSVPIDVIPEAYISHIADESLKPVNLELDTDFNFLVIGQFTGNDPGSDRKNLFHTIKWLCEEFNGDPNVGIVLKTNHGKGTKIDRQITLRTISGICDQIRTGPYPKIHLIHGNMTSRELASIYKHKSIKALVTLTRGEGFGLPILEAAASGVPVIATEWSAHTEFLKHGKFIPINYRMIEIPENRVDDRIFVKNSRWADPLESDFKKKIRKFRNNYEKPKQWASDLSVKIKELYSLDSIFMQYDDFLKRRFNV